MKPFQIYNIDAGEVIGTYHAETVDDALDAMARDYGFADYDACMASYGVSREDARTELQITPMTSPFDYEARRDMIVTYAWEKWTNNGLGLDADDREQTTKSVQDAANNAYTDDINDAEWLAATLKALG